MAPFENDSVQKNRTKQCKIQNGTFFKMTVAKKKETKQCKTPKKTFWKWLWPKKSKQCKIQNGTFLKMTVAKKTEPNSVRYKMAPFKNDRGQENPTQAVQDSKNTF